jgi:RND family efflux transporter MFP subunit
MSFILLAEAWKMRKWLVITSLFLSLGLVSLAGCNPLGEEGKTTQQMVEVVRGDLVLSVSGSGNIETSKETRLSFGSGGRIERIYVEEGDVVRQGDVLARLETDTLELAKTQAEVSLAQAKLALTQAKTALDQKEVALRTAEFELESAQDKKEAMELALLKAQIEVRSAKHHLDETRDIYTWPDIETAQKEVDQWKAYVDYANENLNAANTTQEQEKWTRTLAYAQARLAAAEAKLDAITQSYDTEEVAIAKMQLDAAEMAEAQAQRNLDKVTEEVAIKEQQVELAKEAVAQAREALQVAQQSVELAEQSLAQAEKNLKEATITAPTHGVVASVNAKEGDIIPSPSVASVPVIELIDPGTMELVVEVDEIDIPQVKVGQEAVITLDALPDAEFTGVVTTIYPRPIEVGGVVVYRVKIELEVPQDSGIKVGMSASADIIVERRSNVLLVPDRAIKKDSQGRTIVEVMVNDKIEERPVVIGISDGFNTEVISGLQEGEKVVTEVKVRSSSPGIF